MTGKAKGCSGPHTCPMPPRTGQQEWALQTGSPMPATQSRLRGEKRPRLTAGIAGGPWTSWGRLWSASPQMTPPPQNRAQTLAEEAQDKDCQRAADGQAWAITAL